MVVGQCSCKLAHCGQNRLWVCVNLHPQDMQTATGWHTITMYRYALWTGLKRTKGSTKNSPLTLILLLRARYYLAPIGGGRGIVMPMSVCLFVCLFVCVFVCPCFRKISKCNISAISQPIIMKLGIHITYGYTVTDKYFQNFRSKVKVVGRRKVKNVIWPYLGNEWS